MFYLFSNLLKIKIADSRKTDAEGRKEKKHNC
jgi:hypothetical protein